MPNIEKLKIIYYPACNIQVEYYGDREEIRKFFRVMDLWNSLGTLKNDGNDDYYLFELPKEFYSFAKSDSFMYAMKRHNIEVTVKKSLRRVFEWFRSLIKLNIKL